MHTTLPQETYKKYLSEDIMHFFMRSVLYGSLITTSLAFGLTNIEEKNLINDLHITLEQTATWVQELNEHGILQQPQDITRLTPDNTMIPLYRAYPNAIAPIFHWRAI